MSTVDDANGSAGGLTAGIKTLAIIDLETTGFKHPRKITELTIHAVSVKHFLGEDLPRVQHKLTLCFEPGKELESKAAEITGLTNQLLSDEGKFDANAVKLIESFMLKLQQPVCLIAHNGDNYDFPILKSHIDALGLRLSANLKCCDSLNFFRFIDPGRRSYKQPDIYEWLFNKSPDRAHDAESDVFNLLQCLFQLKHDFVSYVNHFNKNY